MRHTQWSAGADRPSRGAGPATARAHGAVAEFRHEALVYDGLADFVGGTAAFIRDGLERDDVILVVVTGDKVRALRDALDGDAGDVAFADMAHVGHNPARIIPAWYDFLGRQPEVGRGVRGVGEPIWAGRGPAELVECQRHESLLNAAFDGGRPWWLLCPYDAGALPRDVLDEAARSHRHVLAEGAHQPSPAYAGVGVWDPAHHPLPEPPTDATETAFDATTLEHVRHVVVDEAARASLDPARTDDLALAAQELATNTVRHGGGRGAVVVWHEPTRVYCEIRDHGFIRDPLAGRRIPTTEQEGGRGLWIVNQLCDLVQVRTGPSGTVVRLHMAVH
jgi:anti-sigma regulatory factor (Ser/Thr protein kinase)